MAALGSSRFRESAIIRNARPEPLDDRAQLTAPHEWAILACLGLALAGLVLWSLFGSVERTLRLDGVLVLSGEPSTGRADAPGAELVPGDAERIEAVAFAAPEDTWLLSSGMAARVTVASPEGGRMLQAELAAIAPRADGPPDWLARLRPEVASRGWGHVLRLSFLEPPELTRPASDPMARILVDGTPSRIEIVLGRESPIGLLIRP